MLRELYIENVLFIDKILISFKDSLTVVTGQTGSGKSIILESLSIVLGERASASLIRGNTEKAIIIAVFDIENNHEVQKILFESGFEDTLSSLTIKKIITKNGSKIFINDTICTVQLVVKIAQYLIEIHSQFEQMDLILTKNHLFTIDKFGSLDADTADIRRLFGQLKDQQNKVNELKSFIANSIHYNEFLQNAKIDIDELNIKTDEYNNLLMEKQQLIQAAKMSTVINDTSRLHDSSRFNVNLLKLQEMVAKLKVYTENNSLTSRVENLSQSIEQALIELNNVTEEINYLSRNTINHEDRIDAIEERLLKINDFARKYKINQLEIEQFIKKTLNECLNITNVDVELDLELKKLSDINEVFFKAANCLSEKRQKIAKDLTFKVEAKLRVLKMEFAKFEVMFTKVDPNENGIDKAVFIGSMNPGTSMEPIHQIASGGEISRFMLALKTILSDVNKVGTIIFDEIDTGVSGDVAHSIGLELLNIARTRQVITITHNPQVAACGDNHLIVQKYQDHDNTNINVKELTKEERVNELAKMISGNIITQEAILNAQRLLSIKDR